jgi:RNA polymerase sigma factor (sigma-70 family)
MTEESIYHILQTVSSEKTSAKAVNALSSLYSRLHKQVYEACSRVCKGYGKSKEDAEDLAHDVWIKVVKNAHLYRPNESTKTEESKFLSWIKPIAQNILKDKYRKSIDEQLCEAKFFEAIKGVEEDNPQPSLYEKARGFLDGLANHEQDILLTTVMYLPKRIPHVENTRLRTTHNLEQDNIRQIRYRLLKNLVIYMAS